MIEATVHDGYAREVLSMVAFAVLLRGEYMQRTGGMAVPEGGVA